MKVLHLSRTTCSNVPNHLTDAFRKYHPEIEHRWLMYRSDGWSEDPEILHHVGAADVIHWHQYVDHKIYNSTRSTKHVVQYHSEPGISNTQHAVPPGVKQLVIPHYHSALKAFHGIKKIRNLVNYVLDEPYTKPDNSLIISYSPSRHVFGCWQDKGVEKHIFMMKRVIQHFRGKINIKFDVIEDVSWDECMYRKKVSDIVLDECITPSYHLSSLEGLACGKPTICWLDDRVERELLESCGSDVNPFIGVYVGWLEDYLVDFIEKGPEEIGRLGKESHEWYNTYWHPRDIVNDYASVYNSL